MRASSFSIRYCQTKEQVTELENMLKRVAAIRTELPEWLGWGVRCPTEWFAATASEVVRQRLVALNADQEFAGIVMDTAYGKTVCQLAARQG